MDSLPVSGLAFTNASNGGVTDSAASATALSTGIKTRNGRIGMDPEGDPLETILEIAKARGKAVGLVTNVQVAHATPASFAAHVRDRDDMLEISRQIMEFGVDVLLGGGEGEFIPYDSAGCSSDRGKRRDGRNLIDSAVVDGFVYVCTAEGFSALLPQETPLLLGIFSYEAMLRPFRPSLAEMTQTALEVLSQNEEGFFLMVEGGQIDWASHDNDSENVIMDVIGLDEAVARALDFAANREDTLIIVTADHETGGLRVRLSKEELRGRVEEHTMPDGTLFYSSWSSGSHTDWPVPTNAYGPLSHLLAGSYENTHLFHVMVEAMGLDKE
jgi:alkaline phosphatase